MGERRDRPLTLFDACCIGVNAIVGSSIFLFPGRLAAMLGPASVLAFALTGVLLAMVALCFAEASARFDGHGGPYLYARAAFGSEVGFAVGWLCWLTEVVSWAAVADGIASYLGFFDPRWGSPVVVKAVGAGVIVVMGAINYRGVKLGAWTTNAFTMAKLVPLALLVAFALPHLSRAGFAPFAPHGLKPLGAACFLTYFAYSGFEVAPVPAGEVANPTKAIPVAVMASLGVSALFYVLIQACAVGVFPGLAASQQPLADAAAAVMGPAGAALMVVGAVVSTIGFNAGCALGGPRYLAALGEQGDLPERFGARHERFATPALAIAATTALALACALALDFNRLVDIGNVVVCAQYFSTCAAVPLLRRRGPSKGFRAPGGWLLPAAGAASTVWLGSQAGRSEVEVSLALLAAGLAARALLRSKALPEQVQ